MANDEHVALLKQGVAAWNAWRDANQNLIHPDLSSATLPGADLRYANLIGANFIGAKLDGADLSGADLTGAELGMANLSGANLSGANFREVWAKGANFSEANLSSAYLLSAFLRGADFRKANLAAADFGSATLVDANLSEANLQDSMVVAANLQAANLSRANLSNATICSSLLGEVDLRGANLKGANLGGTILLGADLTDANLIGANLLCTMLVNANLGGADLSSCCVYGVSAWGLKLENTRQQNLVITRKDEPEITVDNIEVAQFIYLILHNEKIRDVIDTITSKAVLILGRFTDERKAVLDALREELRKRDYLPILFDFDKPTSQTTDETITLLARMSRFVIADISDAKSVLQELRAIVPDLPSVPVQPIVLAMQEEPGMFDFYRNFRSFLNVHRYASQEQLIADLGEKVIRPAELKVLDLRAST